ncbi:class I SAM-dependent DNA methyltransferase [Spinactinospora alkalitolerans]
MADLLRGSYSQADYRKVILPFTVLRRLECVLAPTRDAVLAEKDRLKDMGVEDMDLMLTDASGYGFYNRSGLTLKRIAVSTEQNIVATNLRTYLANFSENAREIFESYEFDNQITKLVKADLLYQVVGEFAGIDLSPETVGNHQMGYIFENLIRRFSELSNETAGEHFTPREVVELMVNLLLAPDEERLKESFLIDILDPACGTGGMLTAAEEFIKKRSPDTEVDVFGQEINPESYAISRSDLLIKGERADNIEFGNSFTQNRHGDRRFHYLLANPPFGVEWKQARDVVEREHRDLDFDGRFGAGLPRINDGSLLFLQHMVHHMRDREEEGARIAIVFNGSPLFTGGAGSGESEIRRWILEEDLLEGIVALPDQLFYNTGISTYFWILSNRKSDAHKGRVILLDARDQWAKMRKSFGNKRKQITGQQIDELTSLYVNALEEGESHPKVKVFKPSDFGYHRITVERPLKLRFEVTEETLAELESSRPLAKYEGREVLTADVKKLVGREPVWTKQEFTKVLSETLSGGLKGLPTPVRKAVWAAVSVTAPEGEVQRKKDGSPEPDPDLRDYENVPLEEDVHAYLEREVLPHVPDAWIDEDKTKVGYEIPFTRHFYEYVPPRPLEEIDAELKELEGEIQRLLGEVTE